MHCGRDAGSIGRVRAANNLAGEPRATAGVLQGLLHAHQTGRDGLVKARAERGLLGNVSEGSHGVDIEGAAGGAGGSGGAGSSAPPAPLSKRPRSSYK